MGTPTNSTLIADGVTIFLSLIGSAFIAGAGWGRLKSELNNINHRLTLIESMFQLTLKKDADAGKS